MVHSDVSESLDDKIDKLINDQPPLVLESIKNARPSLGLSEYYIDGRTNNACRLLKDVFPFLPDIWDGNLSEFSQYIFEHDWGSGRVIIYVKNHLSAAINEYYHVLLGLSCIVKNVRVV